MKMACSFSEDMLKKLIVDTIEQRHKIFITRNDVKFSRNIGNSGKEEIITIIDLSRHEQRIAAGEYISLTEEL